MSGWFTLFTNCRYVLNGQLVEDHLVISDETGLILKREGYIGGEAVDLDDNIIAPGFLELHTNGANGFLFTHFEDEKSYAKKIDDTARYYATQGVTGFWATIPTLKSEEYQKILPSLKPRTITKSASLLGAHAEGPYLHTSQKAAHNSSLFQACSTSPNSVYGTSNLQDSVKLVTLAPELPDSAALIKSLSSMGIKVSMGHSTASYDDGLAGLRAGATGLTHTLNAMPALTLRAPGLTGLISLPASHHPPPPYYTMMADREHLHPSTVTLLHRSNPKHSILVTDGTSPQQSVRNLMEWSGCGVAEAVGTVTENVAAFMGVDGEGGRGVLREGRRADLTVLSEQGELLQTWVAGNKVWDKEEETSMREDNGEARG